MHYGKNSPKVVNAVIEIPMDSKGKYELDKESGLLKLDRVLFSAVHYPSNYGFIPQTYCGDHDPLDILVICSIQIEPLCLVEAKVIGVMSMTDGGEEDSKIIAVANNDQSINHVESIEELPKHILNQVHRFFEDYKKLEKKEVIVGSFRGKEDAWKVVQDSIELYQLTFGEMQVQRQSSKQPLKPVSKPA